MRVVTEVLAAIGVISKRSFFLNLHFKSHRWYRKVFATLKLFEYECGLEKQNRHRILVLGAKLASVMESLTSDFL